MLVSRNGDGVYTSGVSFFGADRGLSGCALSISLYMCTRTKTVGLVLFCRRRRSGVSVPFGVLKPLATAGLGCHYALSFLEK